MAVIWEHLDQSRVMATDETTCPGCVAQGDRYAVTEGHVAVLAARSIASWGVSVRDDGAP